MARNELHGDPERFDEHEAPEPDPDPDDIDPELTPLDPEEREDLYCRLCLIALGALRASGDAPDGLPHDFVSGYLVRLALRQRTARGQLSLLGAAALLPPESAEPAPELPSEATPPALPFAAGDDVRLRAAVASLSRFAAADLPRLLTMARLSAEASRAPAARAPAEAVPVQLPLF